ncbi:unnamed protein product [Urochloa decumbens]|uniref:Uncharacterized protein n=1 Tax=Urochloa decumbens TaxID=240449 RepID=A0ABC9FMM2_9POAL
MNRRLVNLVVAHYSSRIYSLHRLDVSKHLFYPSTAEAQAANNGRKQTRRVKLRPLPAPIMRFESSPSPATETRWPCNEDMFVLLPSPGGGGRILHTNQAGHATLYDTVSRSVVSVPDLAPHTPGFTPIPFTVAGEESLHVMRSGIKALNFEAIDFGRDGFMDPKWRPLPPPPDPLCNGVRIRSFTVVDGDRTICVAAGGAPAPSASTLAVHVPELGTWLAFSPEYPHQLRAVDLAGVAMMGMEDPGGGQAPAVQHQWEDFDAPPQTVRVTSHLLSEQPEVVRRSKTGWSAHRLHLLNLGSGRFSVAKVFKLEEIVSFSRFHGAFIDDDTRRLVGKFTVLTGVEMVNGGEGPRMVKHKSRIFIFRDKSMEWVP